MTKDLLQDMQDKLIVFESRFIKINLEKLPSIINEKVNGHQMHTR
jgi:hypothetical protein